QFTFLVRRLCKTTQNQTESGLQPCQLIKLGSTKVAVPIESFKTPSLRGRSEHGNFMTLL
ncbi:MAG: hypothetical protein L3J83_06495, partial [Proteobacteria bacterium]|nr:hypothetical protein [Pseudomonadota bacterium]